jgi:hypothetical protein
MKLDQIGFWSEIKLEIIRREKDGYDAADRSWMAESGTVLINRNYEINRTQQQKPPVLERQIDEMVYALYCPAYRSGRLTPEEIAIVEGK